MLQRWFVGVLFLLMASPLSGCGRKTAAAAEDPRHLVKVTVTVDGQPLPDGEIVFQSPDGKAPATGKIKDGAAEFKAVAAKCHVEIFGFRKLPNYREPQNFLPARYNMQSKLAADVAPGGENAFTFKVTSK